MGLETIIAIFGILVSIGMYYAGVRRGGLLERERRLHESQLEQDRRDRELASKVADEYVDMARRHYDTGPTALARLGLESLGSDRLIRAAIHEMKVRSGSDPWGGQERHIQDLDLVNFFRHLRESQLSFFNVSVEEVANRVRASGVRDTSCEG